MPLSAGMKLVQLYLTGVRFLHIWWHIWMYMATHYKAVHIKLFNVDQRGNLNTPSRVLDFQNELYYCMFLMNYINMWDTRSHAQRPITVGNLLLIRVCLMWAVKSYSTFCKKCFLMFAASYIFGMPNIFRKNVSANHYTLSIFNTDV